MNTSTGEDVARDVHADGWDGWIQTRFGGGICVTDPKPEQVNILDIAHALATQCRFTGHTFEPYSIAQHSVLCLRLGGPVRRMWRDNSFALQLLLHDAAEAYLTDVARPVKLHLSNYRELEANLLHAIGQRFGVLLHPMPPAVRDVDNRMLATERQLLPATPFPWPALAEPYPDKIKPWPWKHARNKFLRSFAAITGSNLEKLFIRTGEL